MPLADLLNQSCTITTRTTAGTTDRYGNPDETTATVTTVCYAEQRNRGEDTSNANQQSQDWLVLLPAGTSVDGTDRITIGTLVLEVIGPPWSARNPRTQAVSHVECSARMVA